MRFFRSVSLRAIILSWLFVSLLPGSTAYAQADTAQAQILLLRPERTLSHHLLLDVVQVKEQLFRGFVHRGLMPGYSLEYRRNSFKNILDARAEFRSGVGARSGSFAPVVNFRPLVLSYGWRVHATGRTSLFIGPSLTLSYQYQVYPLLTSGFSYWLTHYDIGPKAWLIHHASKRLTISSELTIPIAGLISRPPAYRDPYFFSLAPQDILSDMHSNMKAVSFGQYTRIHGRIDLLWKRKQNPNAFFGFGYGYEYIGVYPSPGFGMINQEVRLNFVKLLR